MKQAIIEEIYRETQRIYKESKESAERINTKIVQLFTFLTALILLFVNTVDVPTGSTKFLYVATVIVLITSATLLLTAYRPFGYVATDPNVILQKYRRGIYKTKSQLLSFLSGTSAASTKLLWEKTERNSQYVLYAAVLTIVALVLIIITNIL
ncbi:MAG: hypothetical protein OXR66_08735 [Candidatus Woesearchaeota archaeon]|nr:hypothetical protein [Candidatus Woesearchaeota archaeon]